MDFTVELENVEDAKIDYDSFLKELPSCFLLGGEKYEYFIKNDSEVAIFVIDKFLNLGYDIVYSKLSSTFFLRKELECDDIRWDGSDNSVDGVYIEPKYEYCMECGEDLRYFNHFDQCHNGESIDDVYGCPNCGVN